MSGDTVAMTVAMAQKSRPGFVARGRTGELGVGLGGGVKAARVVEQAHSSGCPFRRCPAKDTRAHTLSRLRLDDLPAAGRR